MNHLLLVVKEGWSKMRCVCVCVCVRCRERNVWDLKAQKL